MFIDKYGNFRWGGIISIVVVVFIAIGVLLTSWRDVDPGYLGIKFNKISGEVTTARLTPGNYFINPFTESTVSYPVRTRQYALVTRDNNTVETRDKEAQKLGVDTVINYHIDETKLGQLYLKYGGRTVEDLEQTIILQAILDSVGGAMSTRTWEQANTNKELLAQDIATRLKPKFENTFIVLESVQVPYVKLSEALEALVAAKTERLQQVQTEQAESAKEAVINARAVAKAESDAKVIEAQANAEANATLAKAKAQAEANRLLTESLTPELVRYREVDKWDGRLPQVQGASSVIVGTDILSNTNQ